MEVYYKAVYVAMVQVLGGGGGGGGGELELTVMAIVYLVRSPSNYGPILAN